MRSYKELQVWQKSIDFVIVTYEVTKTFPKEEKYVLMSQMRRCAISIPSNIAEGYTRQSVKEFIKFLKVSFASAAELETQLIVSGKLGFINTEELEKLNMQLNEIQRMLNGLIVNLNKKLN